MPASDDASVKSAHGEPLIVPSGGGLGADIRGVDLRRDEEGEAIIEFIVEAEDLRHLNRMVLGLRRVDGVRAVQRTQKV